MTEIPMVNYLRMSKEPVPKWLEEFKPGDPINMREVLHAGKVVYYPGALFDGQPIMTCNRAHYAHVFIYADYGVNKAECEEEICHRGFKGYHILEDRDMTRDELHSPNWEPHIYPTGLQIMQMSNFMKNQPFIKLFIMERDADYDESHGSRRFVLLYLGEDGISIYDVLFANRNARLDLLVLQDHGWGGNYDKFGKDGLMNQAANKSGIYPENIMCAGNTAVWAGYELQNYVEPVCGGMHNHERWIYERGIV